jgi:hypothetical protein
MLEQLVTNWKIANHMNCDIGQGAWGQLFLSHLSIWPRPMRVRSNFISFKCLVYICIGKYNNIRFRCIKFASISLKQPTLCTKKEKKEKKSLGTVWYYLWQFSPSKTKLHKNRRLQLLPTFLWQGEGVCPLLGQAVAPPVFWNHMIDK